MNAVRVLAVGNVDATLLETLRSAIAESFQVECEIALDRLDPSFAYHVERQQYHSSEILQAMQGRVGLQDWRLLGVTDVDLYIPILKYVFGEAQMSGRCAIVSAHRLHQEFYGLAPDAALLRQRLRKECIHELGHTLGLRHCEDYRCGMASAHAVEWVDLREASLCDSCRAQAESKMAAV